TVLRQVAFDKSVQRYLGSQIYWEKIDEFRKNTGRDQEDMSFSEQDLLAFFKGQYREIKRYILDDVRTAVIHSPDNRLKDYVEFGGKGTEKPLSYNTVEKTFFSFFVHKEPMNVPLGHKLELGENPRQLEKAQLIQLMNIFAEEIFIGKYDFDRGTYRIEEAIRRGDDIPEDHLRAVRMAREEILFNVLRYVRDCIKRFFLMEGNPIEEQDLFQRKFPDKLWKHLRTLVRNFAALPIWINRDPVVSSAVFGGKQTHDYWKHVFETGCAPSGTKVLAKGLNLDDLLA
ncbi:MAG: HNH endonuclease, partial [Thermoleophilia bacterium]|nr:HNH endonuclease [Thermoleophilia bacterium]